MATATSQTGFVSPMSADGMSLLHLDPLTGVGNFAFQALKVSQHPEMPIIHFQEKHSLAKGMKVDHLSLETLTQAAEKWSYWYWSKGVRAYDVVGVYTQNGPHQIVHLCALSLIGAVAAITNPEMPGDTASEYFRKIRAKGIVCSPKQTNSLSVELKESLSFLAEVGRTSLPQKGESFPRFVHGWHDPVMITHSSGTTGAPKPVTLAHGQWFHGIRDNLARQDGRTGDRRLIALPTSHNSAIAFLIHAVLEGGETLVICTQDAVTVGKAIEQFRPQIVAAFSFTHTRLALQLDKFEDLSSVRYWVNSGDAAHEKHIRKLVAVGHSVRNGARRQGSIFVDGLGSSEMGHISFPIQHTLESDHYNRCIGRPHSWVQVKIFDEEGNSIDGVDTVGRLGVKSPSVTPGYWNDSELTARSRRNGFFLTGDLVYRDQQGRYFHVDRVTDVIDGVNGRTFSLLTEEILIARTDAIDDCTVSSLTGPHGERFPVALVWSDSPVRLEARSLLNGFNEALDLRGQPRLSAVFVVRPNEVPLGITGKVLRRELQSKLDRIADDPNKAPWVLDYATLDIED